MSTNTQKGKIPAGSQAETRSVGSFMNHFKGGGARANLFRVTMTASSGKGGADVIDAKTLSFLCKSASIPASTVGVVEVPFRGRTVKVSGDRTYENWSITVYSDEDMKLRGQFEDWMAKISSHEGNYSTNSTVSASGENYMSNLYVEQLGRNDEVIGKWHFVNAWPANLGAIELSYDSNDAVEEFEVELAYQYWQREEVKTQTA